MSKDSTKIKKTAALEESAQDRQPTKEWWGPFTAIGLTVGIYFIAQIVGVLLLNLYTVVRGWSRPVATDWLTNSTGAQFAYSVITLGLALGVLAFFLRRRKKSFKDIGLKSSPRLRDIGYILLGYATYFIVLAVVVGITQFFYHKFNPDQQQAVGFQTVHGSLQLILALVSLVLLPPFVEEILFRGFLYSGLKKAMPILWAGLVTSLLFALPHLFENANGGLLWIAGIDTFILSLVLVYLREKTGSLWASIGLHALKNGLAFISLFVLHQR